MLLHDGGYPVDVNSFEDFAVGLQLFGLPETLGEAYHITDNVAHSWQHIFASITQLAGTIYKPVRCRPLRWLAYELPRGPLLGDKANSLLFDNTKIAEATGG